jgi:hypothetical protein
VQVDRLEALQAKIERREKLLMEALDLHHSRGIPLDDALDRVGLG